MRNCKNLWSFRSNWSYSHKNQDIHTKSLAVKAIYVLEDNPNKIELHDLNDAFGKVHGAAIYPGSLFTTGEFNSKLLFSKSRVYSIKPITIPRFEL